MLTEGQILNERYRIQGTLGQGGMGAVYLATHLQLDEQVAIKEMTLQNSDPEQKEAREKQFQIEARILNRLRHPNLPRVYDFFDVQEHHYLVMDYISGCTLEVFQEQGAVTETQALQWAGELCEVLQYLHGHTPPVIFRDLKPANIMLAKDESLRLIDFGIAKIFDQEEGAETHTVLRGAVSHGFAAPEQYGMGGTDNRSDIYSLGATLYALLTGTVPPASMEVAAGIAEAVPIREFRTDLSDTIVSAIEWMMQVKREMRPPTIAAVQEALGLRTTEAAQASLPQQMRRVLREEFHYFFPAREWFDRGHLRAGLLERMAATDEEKAPLVALSGWMGMGKSRLLRELADDLDERYVVLPVAQASVTLRQQPFGMLLVMLNPWIRRRGESLHQKLQGEMEMQELHEAARVLPGLKPLLSGDTPAQRGPVERARSVMTALTLVFEDAAGEGMVLLRVDDLQWVDDATLRLLDTLRMGPLQSKVAIVVTMEPQSDPTPAQDFIDRWSRKGDMMDLVIPPLSREEIGPYITAMLPPIEGLERRLDTLLDKSQGVPLLLEELLRLLVVRRFIAERNGMLAIVEFRADVLPTTLNEAVRRRKEHLPIDCQEIISQASVVGVRFDLRTVLKLTGETTAALTEALQEACSTLFVVPDERSGYTFTSDATRTVFYNSLPKPVRTALHRKLGTMEEDRATRTGEVTQTAWHYEQAGDIQKSLEFIAQLSQEYLSPKTLEVVVSDALHLKMFQHTADLSQDEQEQAIMGLNMFLRALKSLATYGEHSPVTQTSFGTSITVIMRLLETCGTLSYAYTEDHFYVNNKIVPIAKTPADFKSVLQKHHLSGFEIRPDLDERQFHAFLTLMIGSHEVIEKAGSWWAACQEQHVTAIVVNETVFVGVAEKELFDAQKLRNVEDIRMKSGPVAPSFAPTPPGAAPSIESVLETVMANAGNNDLVFGQLQKLEKMLGDLKANAAGNGAEGGPMSPAAEGKQWVEVDKDQWNSLGELLRTANPNEVKRLLNLSSSVDVPLNTFLQNRPEVLLAGLEHPMPQQRTLSAMGLLNLGKDARKWLLPYLRQTDHPTGRAAALFVLRKIEMDLASILAREVQKCSTSEESMRLLRAIRSGDLQWTDVLRNVLHSPLPEIRRGALQILVESNLEPALQFELIQPLLLSDNVIEVEDGLRFIAQVRQPDLTVPQLGAMLDRFGALVDRFFGSKKTEIIRAQEHVCQALGEIGVTAALPILQNVLNRKGLLGGRFFESAVRAAAIWGLAALGFPEAIAVIEKAVSDPDPNISGTAKYVVHKRGHTVIEEEDTSGMDAEILRLFEAEGLALLEKESTTPNP